MSLEIAPHRIPTQSATVPIDGTSLTVRETITTGLRPRGIALSADNKTLYVAAGEDNLAGKVLLDVSNPLDASQGFPPPLFVSNTDSLAERIQRAFPRARVVKSLNTVTARVRWSRAWWPAATTPPS